ncbi:MAG: hypothetical protein GXO09_01560 [Crenarchaeota archaeon]|nr:hypothetical protein [Thermoproteota archaeon]
MTSGVDGGEGVVRLRLVCRSGDYWCYTLRSWFNEVKDILEGEYNVKLELAEEPNEEVEAPLIVDESGDIVVAGVPEEPGYLIEELKLYLDRRFYPSSRDISSRQG